MSQDGYVHVMLRQQPPVPGQPKNMVRIELSVIDTGKVRHMRSDLSCALLTFYSGYQPELLEGMDLLRIYRKQNSLCL